VKRVEVQVFRIVDVPETYVLPKFGREKDAREDHWLPVDESDLDLARGHEFLQIYQADNDALSGQLHPVNDLSHKFKDVTVEARSHRLNHLLIGVNKNRHSANIAASGLNVPLLPTEVALFEQRGPLRWSIDEQLSRQDVFMYDGTHIFHHLLPVDLDLCVQLQVHLPLLLHFFEATDSFLILLLDLALG
jgi:hypothetical protein